MLSRYVISQVKHNSFFLVGLVLGLWVALVAVPLEEDVASCVESAASSVTPTDEFEPHREERPLGPAGQTAGRSVQRPRYYSTELGMKGSLLAGALSSQAALGARAAALNRTAARLQPALRFFITASALRAAPGLPNVVGFTDTREMLKPFHALKYLADNYLEEYDFFFLVSDTSFVNARRLTELVSKLSVSQDIYMGTVAEDDSHYCSLEGGILLSNSVLRAVHGELDWCVRNSYSPRHHENLGRCVLHAAHRHCTSALQGETYMSMRVEAEDGEAGGLTPALADAVTAYPIMEPDHFYRLHAYVSRVFLERAKEAERRLREEVWRTSGRHPRHYRNATWPGGLRADVGLAAPAPASRFDHLRWTTFNATHAFLPDDLHAVTALRGSYRDALQLVVSSVQAWARARGAGDCDVVGGAWRWEPPRGLYYRLLLRRRGGGGLRLVEAARPLGAARLVPVPYVTESARITVLLPVALPVVAADDVVADTLAFLRRYEAVCLARDKNTALLLVLVSEAGEAAAGQAAALRDAVAALAARHRGAQLDVLDAAPAAAAGEGRAAAAALAAARAHVPRDALLLLAVPHMDFNEDFLNRVRMNTILGVQWFWPVPFARHAQFAHPRFVDERGERPQQDTGRFNAHAAPDAPLAAFYRRDYDDAEARWARAGQGGARAAAPRVLAAALRCVRAPEPGLLLAPRAPPCRARGGGAGAAALRCLRALRGRAGLRRLNLGARHALARLLLETQAERAR
ncbi:chondroitin sulfate synthase 2 isoform X2 [Galleria mellonella]|uniref:Hexosyltransferase n=1 Tax=Galleria mellonella TaxID=7137 RepID=A0ABM3MI80_GALME|nr:chondroitin sulfate synthase 2 isoform X2 [Galleria mellonella]